MVQAQYESSRWQMLFKLGVMPAALLKRHSNAGGFLLNLRNFKEHLFLQNTSTLVAASGSKPCKLIKAYTEILCCWEGNDLGYCFYIRDRD